MYDWFKFRGHIIICTELLGLNLYRYIRSQSYKGLKQQQLQGIVHQLVKVLLFLKKTGVIHCDLKPENILFTNQKQTNVKVIDFGSSCFNCKDGFTYVQSRFYRAPEIVLGLPYSHPADMWSLGCIIAELLTGRPLLPAGDENELLEFMRMMIGEPDEEMKLNAKK